MRDRALPFGQSLSYPPKRLHIIRVQEVDKLTVEESELDEMWSYLKSKRLPKMVMARD